MKGALVCLLSLALATRTSSSNSDPSQAAAICIAEGSDGTLVAHEACDKFYKCSDGKPVALNCPLGLLWNANQNICDWPAHVNCDSKILQKVNVVDSDDFKLRGNTDPSKAPEICTRVGSDGVLIAHEECGKFYKCSEGVPVALNCFPGLMWNAEKEYCDWPDNVKCTSNNNDSFNAVPDESSDPDSSNRGGNSDPSKAPEICVADGSDGVLVAHEECDKFYECSEGKPVALSCPAGLQWNTAKDICDWPANVNCNSNAKESDSANPCASQPSGALVPHEQCSKFYLCNAGTPVALECPDNLLYNPVNKICDWPEQVDCGDRT